MPRSKSKKKNNSSLLLTSRFLLLSCSSLLHYSWNNQNSKDIASSWIGAKNRNQDKVKRYDLYRGVNVFFIEPQRSSDWKTPLEMLPSQICLKLLSYIRLLRALGQALKISKDFSEYSVNIFVVCKKEKLLQVFLLVYYQDYLMC